VSDAPGPGESGPQTKTPAPPPSSPPPPLPPTAAERGGRRSLLLSIAGLLLGFFMPSLILSVAGFALLVASVVIGIRSHRRARRILVRAPGATAGIVIGAIGVFLVAPGLVVRTMVGSEFTDYAKCRDSALTLTDEQACKDRYFPKIEHKLHMPPGYLSNYPNWF
jgi:hypothetical protein